MKLAILVLVLSVLATADNTIDVTCHQCGANACIVMKGGGFNGKDITTTVGSCAEAGTFPATITF